MGRTPRHLPPRRRRPSRNRPNRPTATTEALRAEARGEHTVTAGFGGHTWHIPVDVDTWPTEPIRRCVGIRSDGKVLVDHVAVVGAAEQLLGAQFDGFLDAAPTRAQLTAATHAFAEAVGIGRSRDATGDQWDKAFGAIPRLLGLLEAWPDAVESDLSRFWGIDYRDRWRFDADGRRLLTLRQIHARLSHLPADSAIAIAMNRRSPTELLLMDIYEPLAGRVHPARPLTAAQLAERNAEQAARAKAMADYEARRVARGDRLPDRLQAARANAQRQQKGTT